MEINKIYLGNNLDTLKTFEDNSIDSIVTDPPYGLGKEPNTVDVLKSWLDTGYHEIKGKGFMGKEWDAFVPQPILWKECLRILKPGGYLLSFAGTRTYDWVVMGLRIAGFEIRDQIAWVYGSGFPKSHNIGVAIDKINGVESKVISSGRSGKSSHAFQSEETTTAGDYEIKESQNKWQGYGTALKPALEPIVMARKPLDGTVANNVLKHGVGGINIDGCRVGVTEADKYDLEQREITKGVKHDNLIQFTKTDGFDVKHGVLDKGRFPANFIHDGSEEVVKLFPNSEEDSPARFFYTAKASQSERNFGLSGFEDVKGGSYQFRQDGSLDGKIPSRKNIHPTVKPIDLMQYLVRLVTPKGGICLDPYMGSGTTAIACKSEKINYIGCEIDEDYLKIAEARIKAEIVQYDIFDFIEEK
ncbi:MAG: site-specific DNA-methyltransferase [Sulfolobaceae archaeon]